MSDELVSLDLKGYFDWTVNEQSELSTFHDSFKLEWTSSWTDGTAASQADCIWHDRRSLAGSATDDIDLTALTVNAFDDTISQGFDSVNLLFVVNLSTTAGDDLYIDTSDPTNAFIGPFGDSATSSIEICAGSCLLFTNKLAKWVTTSNKNEISIINDSANVVTYDIVVTGVAT